MSFFPFLSLDSSLCLIPQWPLFLNVSLAPSVFVGTKNLIPLGLSSDIRKPLHRKVGASWLDLRYSPPVLYQSVPILKEITCQPEVICSWCDLEQHGRPPGEMLRGRVLADIFLIISFNSPMTMSDPPLMVVNRIMNPKACRPGPIISWEIIPKFNGLKRFIIVSLDSVVWLSPAGWSSLGTFRKLQADGAWGQNHQKPVCIA